MPASFESMATNRESMPASFESMATNRESMAANRESMAATPGNVARQQLLDVRLDHLDVGAELPVGLVIARDLSSQEPRDDAEQNHEGPEQPRHRGAELDGYGGGGVRQQDGGHPSLQVSRPLAEPLAGSARLRRAQLPSILMLTCRADRGASGPR